MIDSSLLVHFLTVVLVSAPTRIAHLALACPSIPLAPLQRTFLRLISMISNTSVSSTSARSNTSSQADILRSLVAQLDEAAPRHEPERLSDATSPPSAMEESLDQVISSLENNHVDVSHVPVQFDFHR